MGGDALAALDLPATVGALAEADVHVVALMGDGSLHYGTRNSAM
jgi:hypothetical protein